jgi:hypothetical protein
VSLYTFTAFLARREKFRIPRGQSRSTDPGLRWQKAKHCSLHSDLLCYLSVMRYMHVVYPGKYPTVHCLRMTSYEVGWRPLRYPVWKVRPELLCNIRLASYPTRLLKVEPEAIRLIHLIHKLDDYARCRIRTRRKKPEKAREVEFEEDRLREKHLR